MPVVWRLVRPEFAKELDGEGARLFGGRWNSRGRNALYTSSHLSLSVLEVYVHIPSELRDVLPTLQAVQISVPDSADVTRISQNDLRKLIGQDDPLAACRAKGDHWLEGGASLVFEVPSILVPEETNIILNPVHPRMPEVEIIASRAFRFDPRLVVPKV
jgi:RES domain-containing protein